MTTGMAAVGFLILGGYSLWLGWQRLRQGDPRRVPLSPAERAALWLARVFQGEAQAVEWRRKFLRPGRLRQFGVFYLLAGVAMTAAGLLQAAVWVDLR